MAKARDPSEAIRKKAASLPDVTCGTSCNQESFTVGNGKFLFLGTGPKGIGYKVMFKLKDSMEKARELAADQPDRFEVGKTGWVTTRFTADKPLAKSIWEKWLRESYELTLGSGPKKSASSAKKSATRTTAKKGKKTAKKR